MSCLKFFNLASVIRSRKKLIGWTLWRIGLLSFCVQCKPESRNVNCLVVRFPTRCQTLQAYRTDIIRKQNISIESDESDVKIICFLFCQSLWVNDDFLGLKVKIVFNFLLQILWKVKQTKMRFYQALILVSNSEANSNDPSTSSFNLKLMEWLTNDKWYYPPPLRASHCTSFPRLALFAFSDKDNVRLLGHTCHEKRWKHIPLWETW